MSILPSEAEFLSVLRQFNPWWQGDVPQGIPRWKRAVHRELMSWTREPTGSRALFLAGARQVGKTTLFLQAILDLLERGTPPSNILYATFDHPLLKLVGLEETVRLWREAEPEKDGAEFLFLDEIQVAGDWQVWVKHQQDFRPQRRLAFTGSASPLARDGQESGVGRWRTLLVPTLSFFEFLELRGQSVPDLPTPASLADVLSWSEAECARVSHSARPLAGLFHDYLVRGGFPGLARVESIQTLQRLLREDIVDKVLKRDMTAFYGVRRVLELERVFLYLCLHDGGIVNVSTLSKELQSPRQTVENFLDLLEATHLVYALRPFGYGKEVLRGRSKYYLADPAIAPSVMLRGKSIIEDETALGIAVESAVLKHLYSHYFAQHARFSYWRNKQRQEVDLVAEIGERTVVFEVKYRRGAGSDKDLVGLARLTREREVERAYLLNKLDGGIRSGNLPGKTSTVPLVTIPAPLACWWLGASEHRSQAV